MKTLDMVGRGSRFLTALCAVLLSGLISFYLIACWALVHDAWNEPTIPIILHPPPDDVAQGRKQMAKEMGEWAATEP